MSKMSIALKNLFWDHLRNAYFVILKNHQNGSKQTAGELKIYYKHAVYQNCLSKIEYERECKPSIE